MCAILQLVSALLNPRPIDHFRRSHPLCEQTLVLARKIELKPLIQNLRLTPEYNTNSDLSTHSIVALSLLFGKAP